MTKALRSLAAYLVGVGLFFSLLLLAYVFVFTQMTANPDRVKTTLKNSGIYQNLPSVLYGNSVDSGSTSSVSIPLKDDLVRQVTLDTFDAAFVENGVENIIDGTYSWLNGTSSEPTFSVDLGSKKDEFAKKLSVAVAKRLKKLPPCRNVVREIDPYNAKCLPAGANIKTIQKEVYETTRNSEDFLKETTVSPSTLKDSDGKSVFADYSKTPETYRAFLRLPYIVGLICLLFAAATIFVNQDRRKGIKKTGQILAAAGVLVLLIPLFIRRIISSVLGAAHNDKIVSDIINPALSEFAKTASKFYLIAGAFYLLIAVTILILVQRHHSQPKAVKKS